MLVENPVIRGFYPDPSVCKAEGKYYLVCSSMQYFPAVPLFESDDLVHWKQIGHCMNRKSQVDLHKINSSGGVFAPTIRYNDGTFYMVTTNDTYQKNFYVYTNDIYGEWSEPIFVDQGGIDPSLYFENGKTYFVSNGHDESGENCLYQCEINIETGKKITESKCIWKGEGGRYLEGPHLYKFGDWYYIFAAEGGTEYGHMITYARGKTPYGPFENYKKNPVLTNRNLGGYEIQGIGHGDIVEDDKGDYFILCLGFRQAGKWVAYHHLGREVFLVPVYFDEEGWFTAGVNGEVKKFMDINLETVENQEAAYDKITFNTMKDNTVRWCYLRDPKMENYKIIENGLSLRGTNVSLNDVDSPTFMGIRQSEFNTDLQVKVKCSEGEAGVTFYMDENQHYDMAVINEDDKKKIVLRLCIGDVKSIVNEVLIDNDDYVMLKVVSDPLFYYFYFIEHNAERCLGKAQAKYLSSEVAGGFTGTIMAMYAVSDKDKNDEWSEFIELLWEQKKIR